MSSTSRMVWRDEVLVAQREELAGERDVDALAGQGLPQRGAGQRRRPRLHQRLELDAHHVAEPPYHRPLLRRQRRDRAQDGGEPALAAQEAHTHLFQSVAVRSLGHSRQRLAAQSRQLGMGGMQLAKLGVIHACSW